MAEALDKNYHTTRCLLRKMEAAGSIQHVKSHYVALPGENSRNQRNQCYHRYQSVPSSLQLDGQITRGGEPCLPAIDYSDGSDYAHVNVSANGSQTHGIPPPLAGTSLQFPSTPEDLLSQRKDIQDAKDHREVAVINRNQRNQSMSATTRAGVIYHISCVGLSYNLPRCQAL
jgi:hypothetical protein